MNIVITGGHHSSATPLIKKIRKKSPNTKILWYGHRHSIKGNKNETYEYKEITSMGIPFFNLNAGKLYKTYDPIRLLKIPLGVLQALYLLIEHRPKLIISFGGYLAAPVVLAGWLLRIPAITHEQTVVAGYANKFISHFAKKVLISWPDSAKYFPKKKVILTGLPIRDEVYSVKSNSFKVNPELPTIYVTAGKTGSHIINEAVRGCLDVLLATCNVIHQCGDTSTYNDFDVLTKRYDDLRHSVDGKYELRKFIFADEIGEAYSKADLVICRSGAHTSSELIALNKPAIMIPIPWVSHNEQYENAKVVENAGLAVVLDQKNLSPRTLVEEIKRVLSSDDLKLIDTELQDFVRMDSTQLIYDEIAKFID